MGEYINSKTLKFDRSHVSCGVIEAHHIPENTAQALFAIANHLYNKANPRPGSFVIFSDAVEKGEASRGANLASRIAKLCLDLKVGTIISTGPEVNPRTGNTIVLWVFTVNHEAFRKWYQDELANRITE
jgi:hypothetical protein